MENEDDDFGDFADFSTAASLSSVSTTIRTTVPTVNTASLSSSLPSTTVNDDHHPIHHEDDDEFGDFEDSINQATQTLNTIKSNVVISATNPVQNSSLDSTQDDDDDFGEMVEVPVTTNSTVGIHYSSPTHNNNVYEHKSVTVDPVFDNDDDFGEMVSQPVVLLSPVTGSTDVTQSGPVPSATVDQLFPPPPSTTTTAHVNAPFTPPPTTNTVTNDALDDNDDEFGDMMDVSAPNPTNNFTTPMITESSVPVSTDASSLPNNSSTSVPQPSSTASFDHNDDDDAFGDFEDISHPSFVNHPESSSSSFDAPVIPTVYATYIIEKETLPSSSFTSHITPSVSTEQGSPSLHIHSQGMNDNDDDSSSLGEEDFIDTGRSFDLDIQVQAPIVLSTTKESSPNNPSYSSSILYNKDSTAVEEAHNGAADEEDFADFDSAPPPLPDANQNAQTTNTAETNVPTVTFAENVPAISPKSSIDTPEQYSANTYGTNHDDDFADFSSAVVNINPSAAVIAVNEQEIPGTVSSSVDSPPNAPNTLLTMDESKNTQNKDDDDFADFSTGNASFTDIPPTTTTATVNPVPTALQNVSEPVAVSSTAADEFDADFSSLSVASSTNLAHNPISSPSTSVPSLPVASTVDDFDAFGASSSSIDFDADFSTAPAPSFTFGSSGTVATIPSLPSIPPVKVVKENLPVYSSLPSESKTKLRALTSKLVSFFSKLPITERSNPVSDIEKVIEESEEAMERYQTSIATHNHTIEISTVGREGIVATVSALNDQQQKDYVSKLVTIDMHNFLTDFSKNLVSSNNVNPIMDDDKQTMVIAETIKQGQQLTKEFLESQYGQDYLSIALPPSSVRNIPSDGWNRPAGYLNEEVLTALQRTVPPKDDRSSSSFSLPKNQGLAAFILPRPIPIASNMNNKRSKAKMNGVANSTVPVTTTSVSMGKDNTGGNHGQSAVPETQHRTHKPAVDVIKTNIFSPSTQESLVHSANTFSTESALLIGNSLITEFEQSLPDMKYMVS